MCDVNIIGPRAALVLVDLQDTERDAATEPAFHAAAHLLDVHAADFSWITATYRLLADGTGVDDQLPRCRNVFSGHGAACSTFGRTTVDTRGHIAASVLGCEPVYVLGTGAARVIAEELSAAGVVATLLDPGVLA